MEAHVLKRGKRKHEQIFHVIREEITGGSLSIGEPLASEADLCARFDVSRGPVRQALAELQRLGLVRRHAGKGSFVAGENRGEGGVSAVLPETEIRQILVVINALGVNPANFVAYEIIDGLSRAVEDIGENYRLSFQFHRGGGVLTPPMIADCHGIIMVAFSDEAVKAFGLLAEQLSVPVVSLYNALSVQGVSQFYIDHAAGAYDAAEMLIRYGHKRIAMIAEPSISPGPAAAQRESGFLRAAEAGALEGSAATIVRVGVDPLMRRGNIERLLRAPQRPTALVIAGGVLTPFVLDAVRSVGLKVPQDLSIIAFDDTPEAAMNHPRLAVLKMPLRRLARMGIDALLMRLEGQAQAGDRSVIAVKPDLIIAESVAPVPA